MSENSVIHLNPQVKTDSSITAQLRRQKELPLPLRILSSPTTTATLAGGLLGGGFGAVKGFLGGSLLTGLVRGSPKTGEFIEERLLKDPEKAGEQLGAFIEDPVGKTKTAVEKVKEKTSGRTAATAAAGVALGAGGVIAGKQIIERIKEKTTILEQQQATPQLAPVFVGEDTRPIGAKEVPVEAVPTAPVMPDINVNVKVKPAETFINNIVQVI